MEVKVTAFDLAQLRHAYKQLVSGNIKQENIRGFAEGMIAPVIRRMEKTLAPKKDVDKPS